MSHARIRALTIALAALLMAGCTQEGAESPSADSVDARDTAPSVTDRQPPPPTQGPPPDSGARPATRVDTLMLEGNPEPFEARLVDAALYTTYHPSDMIVERSASDEGEGVRFIANFGGTRTDSAFLHIFTPNDPTAGPDAARRLLLEDNGIVRSNGWTAAESSDGRYAWALESYSISGPRGSDLIGSAGVGDHRGRGFVVVAIYPEEYAEGMGPRIASILDALEWKDTRSGLEREAATPRRLE